jgi:hypothetical protein
MSRLPTFGFEFYFMTRWLRLQSIPSTLSASLWSIETESSKALLFRDGEYESVAAVDADYCFLFHFKLQNEIWIQRSILIWFAITG